MTMMPAARMFQDGTAPSSAAAERRAITFDYAFRFKLEGQPGRVVNSVVTVSIEAMFTAVSIGYGVIPEVEPIVFGPVAPPPGPIIFASRPQPVFAPGTLGEILDGLEAALSSTVLKGETGPEAVFKNG